MLTLKILLTALVAMATAVVTIRVSGSRSPTTLDYVCTIVFLVSAGAAVLSVLALIWGGLS